MDIHNLESILRGKTVDKVDMTISSPHPTHSQLEVRYISLIFTDGTSLKISPDAIAGISTWTIPWLSLKMDS